MDPVDVLRHLGGSATRAQLLRQCTHWALAQAVRRAEIDRSGRGRYTLPGLPKPLRTAVALGGALSHASAAEHLQLEAVCRPAAVHVTVSRRAHRQAGRSVVLHYADLDHEATLAGERVTSPLRTVLDCARTMTFREGLAIADSALRRELVTPAELAAAADALAGPGSRRFRRVVAHADARADNPFESALRATVIESGVGGFVPQVLIPDTGYRVDLADPERKIVLEADSFAFHGSRAALDADCRRYDELTRRGWLPLRFSWEQVMFDESWVNGVIVDCCRLRNDRRGGTRRRNAPGRLLHVD